MTRQEEFAPLGVAPADVLVARPMSAARRVAPQGAPLAHDELLCRQIFEHIEDVVYARERDGTYTYISPAYAGLWGGPVPPLDSRQSAWLGAVHAADRQRAIDAFGRVFKGDPFDEEYRVCRPDGEVRWVRDVAFPVEETGGDVLRVVGLVHDTTHERALAAELQHAQKLEALGALASGVAHDFGNVLQAILGCAHLAANPATPIERARQWMRQAEAAAQRGRDMTRQLMDFNRRRDPSQGPVSLDQLVASSAGMLQRLITEQIRLEIDAQAPHSTVLADPIQLEQLIMNLAANARDAMPQGGRLTISTREVSVADVVAPAHASPLARRYLRVSVADTGCGIEREHLARVFNPYFTTKGPERGTGLGLSTVLAVTKRLRGWVEVESSPGEGTVFTLTFPVYRSQMRAATSADMPAAPALAGCAMLVEDDPLVRLTVRTTLEELGLRVIEASGLMEASLRLDEHRHELDVLIADVVMPTMSGPALARMLRRRRPGLRVVFLSAHTKHALVARGTLSQEDSLVQKPFSPNELAEALLPLLDRAQSERSAASRLAEGTSPGPDAGRRPTLLLVEDDEGSRLALAELLEDEGYRVLPCGEPSEALKALEQGEIDLLLTDLRLPEMSGETLAECARVGRPELPVLFMTGLPGPRNNVSGAGFVGKPVELPTLLRTIEGLLQR